MFADNKQCTAPELVYDHEQSAQMLKAISAGKVLTETPTIDHANEPFDLPHARLGISSYR